LKLSRPQRGNRQVTLASYNRAGEDRRDKRERHARDLVSNLLKSKTLLSTPAFAHPSIHVSAQFDTAQRGLSAMFFTFFDATEVKPHSATLISGRSAATFFWNSR